MYTVRVVLSLDNRIKPDLCGIGALMSAKSLSEEDCGGDCDGHSGTVIMEGAYP